MTSRLASRFRSAPARASWLLAAAFVLSACSGQDSNTPAPTATAPASTAPAPGAAPAGTPASTHGTPAGTPATAPQPAQAGPIVPPSGPAPVAGTDYVEIAGGQPFEPASGKIEVVEVFGYTCPHCATFEPLLQSWKAKLPADVRFTPVAAPFGGYWVPYAKAFYTAQATGLLDRTHEAMFRAIHVERALPVQPLPTDAQIGAWYAKHGANAQEFASTMSSFAIDAKLKRATQWLQRSGVESTPTLIVNGKYRVTGKTHEDSLRITDHLIARERSGGAAPAASGG